MEPGWAAPGVLDLIDTSVGEPTAASNTEQRLMESDLVARIYDRFWRPTFVRLLRRQGRWRLGRQPRRRIFIHKHGLSLDDRPGPWLDLSCGPARSRAPSPRRRPERSSWGSISRAMLEVAAQRTGGYTNVVLVRADAHSLPSSTARSAASTTPARSTRTMIRRS